MPDRQKPIVRTVVVTPAMLADGQRILKRRQIEISDDLLVLVYSAMVVKADGNKE
jgi:hypothetical protein